jgi:[FeFe] hydrogenase H-cluster maturation GTPase HydF
MQQITPKSFRLHIALFGRQNVGKSSILNAITRQEVSIVSNYAGTTTDPVEKPMEFLPLGPVIFIDTAGIDDITDLGELRIQKTKRVFDRTDLGIIVTEANCWGEFEEQIFQELLNRQIPIIIILNKTDICVPDLTILQRFNDAPNKIPVVMFSAKNVVQSAKKNIAHHLTYENSDIVNLRQALIEQAPEDFVHPGEYAILVTPIDKEAPKGRLILPQVQAIRDLMDGNAYCLVTQQNQLQTALRTLKIKPKIVVTDSQCFKEVDAITPKDILLTSFSILFARFKGDLISQAKAARTIGNLKPGDKILIAEACSHHPIKDDIGREKIPRLLEKRVGGKLDFTIVQGLDFPENLAEYKLVIHCGACMFNRRLMLNRILKCNEIGVPLTNYGLAISYCLGIFERALKFLPEFNFYD